MTRRRQKLIFIYLLIVTLFSMGISFSRFSTTLTNSGAENNVLPDIEFSTWVLEYQAAEVLLENMMPGDSKTIAIQVQNWEEGNLGKISDYHQIVKLELETTGNLNLEYTLEIEKENGWVPVGLYRLDYHHYQSKKQEFFPGNAEIKKYRLTITWPRDEDDHRYKNEIDYLELGLRAVQAD